MLGGMFGGQSAVRSGGEEAEEVFLNLTPMIDILTCLLFFLLLSFGAVLIALVNASVPVISEGEGDPNVSQDKITMGLQITEKGMLLTASHDKLPESELDKLKRFFPKSAKGEHDFKKLHDHLFEVKRHYPRSSNIVITPVASTVYADIIGAMDASRERQIEKNKRPFKIPMFPEAVVSTIVE